MGASLLLYVWFFIVGFCDFDFDIGGNYDCNDIFSIMRRRLEMVVAICSNCRFFCVILVCIQHIVFLHQVGYCAICFLAVILWIYAFGLVGLLFGVWNCRILCDVSVRL